MTAARTPPNSIEAEEALLGAMLLAQQARADVANIIVAGDFYKPAHALIFDAMATLRAAGDPVDVVTVADHLERHKTLDQAGGRAALLELQTAAPSTTNAARFAGIVVERAALRRIIGAAGEITDAAYNQADPLELVDRARALLDQVDIPSSHTDADLHDVADFLSRPDHERAEWVIHGLIRQDWRVVIVAPEGVGKTVLLRQLAVCAAFGIHPFTGRRGLRPMRSLIVDLENPDDSVVDVLAPMWARAIQATGSADNQHERVHLWHKPGGIDLRRRADRSALEAVLTTVRPELVAFGPLYKAARKDRGEGWDEVAIATQSVLDDLRTRYRFALVMEDHAPQGDGKYRELRPFGSSLWLRWPELGLSLKPKDPDNPHAPRRLRVGRFRGDRLHTAWPVELQRGHTWPWVAASLDEHLDGVA